MATKAPARLGVLVRDVPVRVLRLSAAGCLVEIDRGVHVGTFATMRLRFGSEDYRDDVQVVRCQTVVGAGSVYRVGMQFLWTTPPHARSIRHAVAPRREVPGAARPAMTRRT
jgi:hypothetical protein